MTTEELMRWLAEKALPVDAKAALRGPGPGCLSDGQLSELAAGGGASPETLHCLANHVANCRRCWSLVALVVGDAPVGNLAEAEAAVDRAVARHLSHLPVAERRSVVKEVLSLVIQWLPGAIEPDLALAGAMADDSGADEMTLEVSEAVLPLAIHFSSPDGVPAGVPVALVDEQGCVIFEGTTDAYGSVVFGGPAGTYRVRIAGYTGPVLAEGDL